MIFKKDFENKYVNNDGTITTDPTDRINVLIDQIEKLEKKVELLSFTGMFDFEKISFNRRMLGVYEDDGRLFSYFKPEIKYVSYCRHEVKTKEFDITLFTDVDASKDIKWYEVLHNDERESVICLYKDNTPRFWFVLDKKRDTLTEIPDLSKFTKSVNTKEETNDAKA